jgi:hypothetical protein
MDGKANTDLAAAVAGLRQIADTLKAMEVQADSQSRADVLQIQQQSEAAMRYYASILPRPSHAKVPAIALSVAQAAFGAPGIGLVPPQFTSLLSSFKTRS